MFLSLGGVIGQTLDHSDLYKSQAAVILYDGVNVRRLGAAAKVSDCCGHAFSFLCR